MGENKRVIALLEPLAQSRPDDLAIAYMLGTALMRDDQPSRGKVIIDRILRHGDSVLSHKPAKLQVTSAE